MVKVAVIGAGAVGMSVALRLQRDGNEVSVFEKQRQPGTECSNWNAGLIAPSQSEPFTGFANILLGLRNIANPAGPFRLKPSLAMIPWLRRFLWSSRPKEVRRVRQTLRSLTKMSVEMYGELERRGEVPKRSGSGMLSLFKNEASLMHGLNSLVNHPAKPQFEVLREADVASLSTLHTQCSMFGIRTPGDGHIDGASYVRTIEQQFVKSGGTTNYDTLVLEVVARAGAIVGLRTAQGFIEAERVVIAGGVESVELVRPLGVKLPVSAGKGFVLEFDPDETDPTQPLFLKDDKVVLSPYKDRLRVSGVMEFVGSDRSVSPKRIQTMQQAAAKVLPRLAGQTPKQVGVGQRPCTSDGLPIIGSCSKVAGLFVATGHGQQGLVLAPVTAELISASMKGARANVPGVDESRLSPERFSR